MATDPDVIWRQFACKGKCGRTYKALMGTAAAGKLAAAIKITPTCSWHWRAVPTE